MLKVSRSTGCIVKDLEQNKISSSSSSSSS